MSRNKEGRDKLIQEKLKSILDEILRSDDNRYCADCNTKGGRHDLTVNWMCAACWCYFRKAVFTFFPSR